MLFDEFGVKFRSNERFKSLEENPYQRFTESDKRELFNRWRRMFNNPLEFLNAVRTHDEADRANPVKKFPIEKEYVRFLVALWQRNQFLAIPKSRRMLVSWTSMGLITHESIFAHRSSWAAVSKKEEDSDALVERCKFILDNLDEEIFPKEIRPEYAKKYCNLDILSSKSRIHGYPSGADQLRQHGFTGIFGDEIAFWMNAEQMWKASSFTLQTTGENAGGGGKFVAVSSRAPSWFKRLVYDRLDDTQIDFSHEKELESLSPTELMEGFRVWKNPKNQFVVADLNYRADPAKRSVEWLSREKAKVSERDWNQEMEDSWDSYEGLPVYGGLFNPALHLKRNLRPKVGLPLLLGFDFGLTPACVVAQLWETRLVLFKEYCGFNIGTDRFSDLVIPQINLLFPGLKWITFIDPAGLNRDQSDEGQSALILDQKGMNCFPGPMGWDARRKPIEEYLRTLHEDGGANLWIDELGCPVVVRGFKGGYRYPEKVIDREPNKLRPLKDEHSHPHDAVQYIGGGIKLLGVPRDPLVKRRDASYNLDSTRRAQTAVGPMNMNLRSARSYHND